MGRRYFVKLKDGLYTKEVSFSYMVNTPGWMENKFNYKKLPVDTLKNIKFKDFKCLKRKILMTC